MFRPEALKSDQPLPWSTGTGVEVWETLVASVAGDLATIRRLMAANPALVRCQHAYLTPLHFAVRENRIDVAGFLLDLGADPLSLVVGDSLIQMCRDRGYEELEKLLAMRIERDFNASPRGEPVAAAIRERDLPRMRSLLDAEPDLLNVGDERSNRPIHWAVMTRQLDVVDELLARGADLESARFDGAKPLQLCNGDYHFRGWRDVPKDWPVTARQMFDELRARGADCDIASACQVGDLERVRELLAGDPGLANRVVDYTSYYLGSGAPLKNAAAGGHLEIVKLLLEHGADPNLREEGIAPHGHALYAAAANRHYEIAELLLQHGAYPNPEVESSADALSRALDNEDARMVELLCSYGAAREMHLLAAYGDLETAAAVFAANPAKADDADALANAAGGGYEAFVRLMLRYQPTLASRIEFPGWIAGAKTKELNELLFAHGMSPSQPSWLLVTPLHQLAQRGDVENAAFFLDSGADLHARDESLRSTPLGWAAKYGQAAMVDFLLERGADPDLADAPWATPLAWATRRGHAEIAERLRRAGAR